MVVLSNKDTATSGESKRAQVQDLLAFSEVLLNYGHGNCHLTLGFNILLAQCTTVYLFSYLLLWIQEFPKQSSRTSKISFLLHLFSSFL